ncbi:MAG: hypothetical protein KME16_25045 [Scytolyngbya sp. HA4215-MV1]|nr:hypothetical protein [Scytolyngbya sp. HA4215-MV1]
MQQPQGIGGKQATDQFSENNEQDLFEKSLKIEDYRLYLIVACQLQMLRMSLMNGASQQRRVQCLYKVPRFSTAMKQKEDQKFFL